MTDATPKEVAQWMVDQLTGQHYMYQDTVAHQIKVKFGDKFTYRNANGNTAITKDVLAAFRRLTGDAIVWERSSQLWRPRRDYDKPGRQQD